jgi:adenylate kinase
MLPNLIVLGAPGSGKGTQAEKISKFFGYKHLSTGDLLRSEIEKKSELGLRVQEIMAKGNLVSDEIVLELLKTNFKNGGEPILLDGFPRNIKQASLLDEHLFNGSDAVKAIYFNVDLSVLKDRIVNRRTCKKCGEIYNLKTKPYGNSGECLKCGNLEILQRKDDTEEVVTNRLNVFKDTFEPVMNYYRAKHNLLEVNAQQDEQAVFEELKKLIEIYK